MPASLITVASPGQSSFGLPSHFEVGPTACHPERGVSEVHRVNVEGNPLPIREDFTFRNDAFEGKSFVRFPRRNDAKAASTSYRTARLRSEEMPFDSFWLPHHCVVGDNTLRKLLEETPRRGRLHMSSRSAAAPAR